MTPLATPILALLLALPAPASPPADAAARPSVSTRVTAPARLTVGDRFDVTLVVRRPARGIVTGPLADTLGVFVVADEKRSSRVRGGIDETTYRLSVAGFRPGRQRLPSFTFFINSGDHPDTLHSDTASVTIASVLPPKMTDVHPLKPAESFPNLALWLGLAGAVLLAALAWFGRRLWRRLRGEGVAAPPPLPPWDEALAALDAMPWNEWLADGQVKRYHYALSEVLKRYIERRFEFGASEQTTTELLAAMRANKAPLREEVARFLARADLVKYSKVVPAPEESRAAIDQVRDIVLRTKPAEPAPEAPAAAAGGGA